METNFVLSSLWAALLLVSLPGTRGLTDSEKASLTSPGELSIADSSESGYYQVTTDGIPNHATADFPTSWNDNTIKAQPHSYKVPSRPTVSSTMTCLPPGPIGFAKSGSPFFNPYTARNENAVEGDSAEMFDQCSGHPDDFGSYHYHGSPACIGAVTKNNMVVGIALDGFPIYGTFDENGNKLTSADLDDCHGRTVNGQYQYHITDEFPYIIGCFKGAIHPSINTDRNCFLAISDDAGTGTGSGGIRHTVSTILMVSVAILLM